MTGMIMTGLVAMMLCAAVGFAGTAPSTVNARDFGATGDGKTDDTAAIQKAIDSVSEIGGGVVHLPTGNYLIKTGLILKPEVALEGVWQAPTIFTQMKGTTLLAVNSEGGEEGTPFIIMKNNSVVKGLNIFYPEQSADDPKPYPWMIRGEGENPTILDVLMVNPWIGVNFGHQTHGRHYIRNLHGQPLKKGIFVDQCYDVGHISDIHLWPFWNQEKMIPWTQEHGEAFIFARTDWEAVTNTFCLGYKVGYRFTETTFGPCNGSFLNIGADACSTSVLIEQSFPYGLLITNSQFVAVSGENPTMVRVTDKHAGVVRFVNSAFWGPCNQIANIAGTGTVGFGDCTFVAWSHPKEGLPAIEASGGTILIRGCEFREDKAQIKLNPGVTKAVISGNVFTGSERIENTSSAKVAISGNVGDE